MAADWVSDASALTAILNGLADENASPPDPSELAFVQQHPEEGTRLRAALGRLYSEFARLRRRERELAALFSSARDLAESRDVDTLLTRLVARAHEMMGMDITYLSEFDPENRELRVRRTLGAVTPAFQNLRVPPGVGIASGIAMSRTPISTQRYSDYAGDPHDSVIDHAVDAEGVVSILGVPMLAEDSVLGVLFVATRHEHVFAPEETALLSALADHASVIMQTAGILNRLQESEEESRRALVRLSDHLEARDRSNVVHQQLIQAILSGEGFPAVADTLAQALARGVAIVDVAGQVIAESDRSSQKTDWTDLYLSTPVQEAVAQSCEDGHAAEVERSARATAVCAISVGTENYGSIVLGRGGFDLGPVDRRTVERAAQVCSLLTLQNRAADDADRRTRSELVSDMLDESPERRHNLDRRARHFGVEYAELNGLAAAVVGAESRTSAVSRLAAATGPTTFVAQHAGVVVVLGRFHDLRSTAEDLHRALKAGSDEAALVVIAPTVASPDRLPESFASVLRVARLLQALEITDGVAVTSEYELFSILFSDDPRRLDAFIATTIGPVLDYDAKHNADLTNTLRAFVRNGGSPTKTARVLNYHPNTILQRLDRIKALLGAHWRDDEPLYRISTAVRLHQLRSVSRGIHESNMGDEHT